MEQNNYQREIVVHKEFFLNKSRCVILLNGFQKKSKRTPKREIVKAVKLKAEYFNEKED